MCRQDLDGKQRFALYLNVFLAGNPLGGNSKKQISTLKDLGVKISN